MNLRSLARLAAGALVLVILPSVRPIDAAAADPRPQIVAAVMRGDCKVAVDSVNRGVDIGDGQAIFWGARMLDEGVCVPIDHAAAAKYYARAAELGDRNAVLETAALTGLGQGVGQSYERAGEICRQGGIDPQERYSLYELGYACTLRAVAGRQVRQNLPPRSLRLPADAAQIAFHASSAELEILSLPSAALAAEPATGSHMRDRRSDLRQAITEAWTTAMHHVPGPDAARLDAQPIELPVDVDTSLEAGPQGNERGGVADFHQRLTPGDLHMAH